MDQTHRLVYMFDEGPSDSRMSSVRGNKGNFLAELVSLGMPVPPGATITTEVAHLFALTNTLPHGFSVELKRALHLIEAASGFQFGSFDRPLLLAVRSGAPVSMPGMMDTVLNVGLNPDTVNGLAATYGERFAWDCYRRFLAMFGSVAMEVPRTLFDEALTKARGTAALVDDQSLSVEASQALCREYSHIIEDCCHKPVPRDPDEQLDMAIRAVLLSWHSKRAGTYRICEGLSDNGGSAVNIQAMVFGNCDQSSGTGVVFSADPATGAPGLYGEYLPQAQGEDLVAGVRTPLALSALAERMPDVYNHLLELVARLVAHYNDMLEIEFTVQSRQLFLLQCRSAKRTTLASVVFAVDQVGRGKWSREQALACVRDSELARLRRPTFEKGALAAALAEPDLLFLRGLPASPGCVVGELVFDEDRALALHFRDRPFIMARSDTLPEDLPLMLKVSGILTANGGLTSHAAVVARAKGIPAVVGCGFSNGVNGHKKALWNGETWLNQGEIISLDGASGHVFRGALPFTPVEYCQSVRTFFAWVDQRDLHLPVRPVDMSWRSQRHCLNRWLNDFYLCNLMTEMSGASVLEERARLLKNQVETDLVGVLTCYLLCAVAHEIMFFCYRQPEQARSHQSWCVLQDRYCVQIPRGGQESSVAEGIVQAVSRSSVAEQADFFALCAAAFNQLPCWDQGFGRGAWADIAQAAFQYLSGAVNRSIYIDQVFNLRHHGNAMFNNNVMVSYYTREKVLQEQLEAKKHATGIGALYTMLTALAACDRPVSELFQAGLRMGLWPDGEPLCVAM